MVDCVPSRRPVTPPGMPNGCGSFFAASRAVAGYPTRRFCPRLSTCCFMFGQTAVVRCDHLFASQHPQRLLRILRGDDRQFIDIQGGESC